jgi:uncharacterized protein HemX
MPDPSASAAADETRGSDSTVAGAAADQAVAARHEERRHGERRRLERAVRQAALALLIALAAAVLGALIIWRLLGVERALEREHAAQQGLAALEARIAALEAAARADALELGRLAGLPAELERAGTRIAGVEARIDAPQRAVARVEAAHLVELANHRLALERDVRGAITLYEAADARLAPVSDPGLTRIRAQLGRDLAALRAVAEPDLPAIGARLAAASERARRLPMLGAIKAQYLPPGRRETPGPGLARAWQQFTTALRDLVTVRRVSEAAVGLVSMEEIGVRRLHLETLLIAARFAALRGEQREYATSLRNAREWLASYFDGQDAGVQALATELAALEGVAVSPPLPDVGGSLRLLREDAR